MSYSFSMGDIRVRLLIALLLITACGGTSSEPNPPNLILIIGDDHGYPDFGFMGSPVVKTPHLDRLADQGFVFRAGFNTSSLCRPSMNSLLTGLVPYQWDLRNAENKRQGSVRERWREIPDFQTLPRLLSEHGYATLQAGKQWEGTFEMAGFTHGPKESKDYRNAAGRMGGKDATRIMRRTLQPVYNFIEEHQDTPFFVWLAPLLPHTPHDAPQRFLNLYSTTNLSMAARRYYANVTRFDASVGALLNFLESKGLRENTLLVYVADNGWEVDVPGIYKVGLGGLGGKYSLNELGLRTPILFSLPGHVPAGQASNALISTADLFPTFLDYAGIPQLADRLGKSLRPLLEGRVREVREVVIGRMEAVRAGTPVAQLAPGESDKGPGGAFLRDATWHYIWYRERDDELYNVQSDPEQRVDVAGLHPELTAQFREQIVAWEERMKYSVDALVE
jgi:uncharacterized sulfatase